MTAYNDIDGVPCTASRTLFREILHDEWGFNGVVVSDYQAVRFLRDQHRIAADDAEAAAEALAAGVDVELPATNCFGALPEAIDRGLVSEEQVDEAVSRVLRGKLRAGLLDDAARRPAVADAFGGRRRVRSPVGRHARPS